MAGYGAARITDKDNDRPPNSIVTGSSSVIIGDTGIPLSVSIAPGVILIGGATVYDSSPQGQLASLTNEQAFDTNLPGSVVSGDAQTPSPSEQNPAYVNCNMFPTVITSTDMSTLISKWFKLSSCREMPIAQRGLTASQIACNWAALCINILDPVYSQFKFSFNSGFRNAGRDSGGDHGIGCAADISLGSDADTLSMYKWMIQNNLPFSQIIYEKHKSSWVHVAYNGKGPKGDARTMWTLTGTAPYQHGGQNGQILIASNFSQIA